MSESGTFVDKKASALKWANAVGHFMMPALIFLPVVLVSMGTIMQTIEITKVFNEAYTGAGGLPMEAVLTPGLTYRERRFPYNGAEKSDDADRIEHNGILTATQVNNHGLTDVLVKPTIVTGSDSTQPPDHPNSAGHLYSEADSKAWKNLVYVMYGLAFCSAICWYLQVHIQYGNEAFDTFMSRYTVPLFAFVNASIMAALVSDLSPYGDSSKVTLQGLAAPNVNDTGHAILGNGTNMGVSEQSVDTGVGLYLFWTAMLSSWVLCIGALFVGYVDKFPQDKKGEKPNVVHRIWQFLLLSSVIIIPFMMQSTVGEKLTSVDYASNDASCPVVASVQFNVHSVNVQFTLDTTDANSSAVNLLREDLIATGEIPDGVPLQSTRDIEAFMGKATMLDLALGDQKSELIPPKTEDLGADSKDMFTQKLLSYLNQQSQSNNLDIFRGTNYYVKVPIGTSNGTVPTCAAPGTNPSDAAPVHTAFFANRTDIKYLSPICSSGGLAFAYFTSDAAVDADFLGLLYDTVFDGKFTGTGVAPMSNITYTNFGWEYIRTVIGLAGQDQKTATACPYSELGLTYSGVYSPSGCDSGKDSEFCRFSKSGLKVWQFIIFILLVPFLLRHLSMPASETPAIDLLYIVCLLALLASYIYIYAQFHIGLMAVQDGSGDIQNAAVQDILKGMTGKTIAGYNHNQHQTSRYEVFDMETTALSFTVIAFFLAIMPPVFKMISDEAYTSVFALTHHMDSYNAQMW